MGADDLMLSVGSELPAGEYVVEWRAGFGEDLPPTSREFEFSIGTMR